jgi:hypothetical protein
LEAQKKQHPEARVHLNIDIVSFFGINKHNIHVTRAARRADRSRGDLTQNATHIIAHGLHAAWRETPSLGENCKAARRLIGLWETKPLLRHYNLPYRR